MSKIQEIIIVSGLSGAGKTTALKALEDINFYSVDNLPLSLIPVFLDLMEKSDLPYEKIALGIDVREKPFLPDLNRILKEVELRKINHRIIFLSAKSDVLLKRFKEARRTHPLGSLIDIREAIKRERKFLSPLREKSNLVIDTSRFNIHELRQHIMDIISHKKNKSTVILISFGFSRGVPENADLVFNVRSLPNPFFIEELKNLSGLDSKVKDFFSSKEVVNTFIEETLGYIKFFLSTLKTPLWNPVIAVGCTGGRHRSVYVVDVLSKLLSEEGYNIKVTHRDMEEV